MTASNDVIRVDAEGLKCPEPVMLLHGAIRDAKSGDTILLTATDPSTRKDVTRFCEFLGHTLSNFAEDDGVYTLEITKGGGNGHS